MNEKRLNFTKTNINALSLPTNGKRTFYYDAQVRGLAVLMLPSGARSFYVRRKIKGRAEKIFLGRYPDLSVENARNLAKVALGQISMGINPNEERRKIRNEMTFGELFQQYMERYSKVHKKSWHYDEREVKKFLSDWFTKKISDLTRNDVQRRLEKVFKENGLYQSNRILERIRAIYNKAIEWGWEGKNPALGIKKHKEKARDRFIQVFEMPYVLRAIENEANETARDYFLMLLLTGARKSNTLQMRWEQITWEECVWKIPETKNGEPVLVPLTQRALDILQRRLKTSTSDWVFDSRINPGGHFVEGKRAWKRILERATLYYWASKVTTASLVSRFEPILLHGGSPKMVINAVKKAATAESIRLPNALTDIRVHDIRRTFGSYQAIAGASLQVIGKSLGHKSIQATQIYARLNLNAVKKSVETATDMMFAA